MRIVPAFDKLKNDGARFSRCVEACAVEQFAFEGCEEAFTQGIVKAITDRAHGRADASFAAAATKGKGGVLATMIGMMDDILGMTLLDSHTAPARSAGVCRACRTSSVCRWVAMAQPTIRRLQASSTTARYRNPAQVGI